MEQIEASTVTHQEGTLPRKATWKDLLAFINVIVGASFAWFIALLFAIPLCSTRCEGPSSALMWLGFLFPLAAVLVFILWIKHFRYNNLDEMSKLETLFKQYCWLLIPLPAIIATALFYL